MTEGKSASPRARPAPRHDIVAPIKARETLDSAVHFGQSHAAAEDVGGAVPPAEPRSDRSATPTSLVTTRARRRLARDQL